MDQKLTKRLIDVRQHIDSIEAIGGLYLDVSEMIQHALELIEMRSELEELYRRELSRICALQIVTASEEDDINAMAETLEAAQQTAVWLVFELRSVSPVDAERPEIIDFLNAVQQMHEFNQSTAEPDIIRMPDD